MTVANANDTDLLRASVVGFLHAYPASTAREIALGVHTREAAVRRILNDDADIRTGRRGRATVYQLGPAHPTGSGGLSGCQRILARLRQGPATAAELYALGAMTHSRVSELRRRGYLIDCERTGGPQDGAAAYTYRLVGGGAA